MNIIAARLTGGAVIGYDVPIAFQRSTWDWLNSLPCVVTVWEESQRDFRARRLAMKGTE